MVPLHSMVPWDPIEPLDLMKLRDPTDSLDHLENWILRNHSVPGPMIRQGSTKPLGLEIPLRGVQRDQRIKWYFKDQKFNDCNNATWRPLPSLFDISEVWTKIRLYWELRKFECYFSMFNSSMKLYYGPIPSQIVLKLKIHFDTGISFSAGESRHPTG